MKDWGNDPDWFIDASGNRYHRKPQIDQTANGNRRQPRHYLYGAGTGGTDRTSRMVDKFFDGLITVTLLAVGIFAMVALFGMLEWR